MRGATFTQGGKRTARNAYVTAFRPCSCCPSARHSGMRIASILTALALSGAAYAQAACAQTAPKGWKGDASGAAWPAASPDQKGLLAFSAAVKSASAFVFWFQDEGLRRTSAYSRTIINQD